MAIFFDYHERRANTTGSLDEEIRLLWAHTWVCLLFLTVPTLLLALVLLGFVAVFKASGIGVAPDQLVVSLGVGTGIGAATYLLRSWLTSRRSTGKNGRSSRPRRR
ncbi:hypothetical protein I0C86_12095 [Plantactinospora sp. S1510]|uniref:Uncharacterized protein n=1 Tax=Plantactinospora alkalitolerans TaxID=2789879 RepID=A0ABS0GU13_9ACTN|nr:hypothetical protein [Plantactinospora alkalitolerans]MBF9129694.1 hypothetical protein [Plantactinospora alkalitolerans]